MFKALQGSDRNNSKATFEGAHMRENIIFFFNDTL
jgi:hypothetical protein